MAGLDQIINSLRATFYIFLMLLYGTIANILFIFIGFCISPFYPAWGYEIISQVA